MTPERSKTTPSDGARKRAVSEGGLRLISALILGAGALALAGAGLWPFVALVSAGGLVGAWEWGRLIRGRAFDAGLFVHGAGIVGGCVLMAAGRPLMALGAVALGSAAIWPLTGAGRVATWSACGVAYIALPAMALVFLRSDGSEGWHAVLFLFVVVWATDSAAYFAGRGLGGPKLWPRVSPKKTWSGAIAGLLAGALVGLAFSLWQGHSPAPIMMALGAGLALTSELGDFAESAAKRAFGHKDMSNLIPGHGGVLDRVDSLLFASLAAAAIALIRDPDAPGAALMIWP